MEEAQLCRGSADRPETTCLDSAVDRGGSDRHRVSSAHLTVLPLDDCLYALQATIPHLTRSLLHRCLKRHGISRLSQVKDEGAGKRKFKAYPIGHFQIDIAELRTAEGKLYCSSRSIGPSKFAFVTLREKADRPTAVRFL